MFCPAGEEFPSSSETINQRQTKQRDSISLSKKATNKQTQKYKLWNTKFPSMAGGIAQLSPALNEAKGSCPSKSATSFVFVASSRHSDD